MAGFIGLKTAGSRYSRESGCFGFTVTTPPSTPPPISSITRPFIPPECLACTQSLMGLAGGLIEGRQLHWGAGSLAWVQGVAGLRGIGQCLLVMQRVWHSRGVHTHTHTGSQCRHRRTHTMYKIQAPKVFWQLSAGSWGAWMGQGGVSDWHNSEERTGF